MVVGPASLTTSNASFGRARFGNEANARDSLLGDTLGHTAVNVQDGNTSTQLKTDRRRKKVAKCFTVVVHGCQVTFDGDLGLCHSETPIGQAFISFLLWKSTRTAH